MLQGIDFTNDHSGSAHGFRSAGKDFVMRYCCPDGSGISAAEARSYRDAALGVGLVFEWEARRATRGARVGAPDAREFAAHAARAGFAPNCPLPFAVDFDAAGPEVHDYFVAARNIVGDRTWAYGGYRVVEYLFSHGLIHGAWQTYAWSGGRWHPKAAIRQVRNDVVVAGVSCDLDTASTDSVLSWAAHRGTGDVFRTLYGGMDGEDVKALVEALMWLNYLPYPVLGRPRSHWGGWVNTAIARFQRDHSYREFHGEQIAYGSVGRPKLLGTLAARKRAGWTPRTIPPLD